MAKASKTEIIEPMEKIARLLAMAMVKDMKLDDAALKLDLAGFDAKQIGLMIGVNDNYIHYVKNKLKSKKPSKE